MRAAVIIPVFNEGDRVLEVAEAAMDCHNISEVVAVNDGSTDNTQIILEKISNLTIINHPENRGKGQALDTGMTFVREQGYDQAVFLDGDLLGIKPDHIHDLLLPLQTRSYMSIGYLGLRKAVVKSSILQNWGALSGQRAIRTEIWDLLSEQDKKGWNIEAALNARLRKHNLHRTISRVALEGVGHVGKRDKLGSWPAALSAYSQTYGSALATYIRIEKELKQ